MRAIMWTTRSWPAAGNILLEEIEEITLCGSFATALDALNYIEKKSCRCDISR